MLQCFICAYPILSLNMYVLCLCSNYVCARPRFIARACIIRSGCAEQVCATSELEAADGAACSRRERSHRELGFYRAGTSAKGPCDRPVAWSALSFVRVA